MAMIWSAMLVVARAHEQSIRQFYEFVFFIYMYEFLEYISKINLNNVVFGVTAKGKNYDERKKCQLYV